MKHTNYRTPEGKAKIQERYTEILKEWHTPRQELLIDTRHGKTFIIASGDISNPPLVLLHGSGSSSFMWTTDSKIYSNDYRVYALDIPGEAGKSDPVRFSWKDNSIIEWLDDIYKELNIPSAILTGISLGGFMAAKYAIHRPEAVSALALLCSSGIYDVKTSFYPKAIFYSLTGNWGLKQLEKILFQQEIEKEVSDYFRLMSKEFIPRMEQPPVFTDEELQRMTMPLLYIGGEKDVLVNTVQSVKRLQKILPHSRACLLPKAGHGLTDTSSFVLNFLQAHHK